MTNVKICGITSFPDAEFAVNAGADALGFNFYSGSRRFIAAREAESIVERLLQPVEKVGVFVNQEINEILDADFISELDAIQLHGDEDPAFVRKLRNETDSKLIKAFRVGADFRLDSIAEYDVDAVLLDAYTRSEFGGTGEMFDWSIAKAVVEMGHKVYLAGGLDSSNVRGAIKMALPYAVDVSSGVESSPGKKDPRKVEAFIKAVRKTAISY